LGDVHLRLAQYAAARAWYKKALLLYRSLGDQLGEAHYVKSLGDVHFGMAEYAEAQECYEEARLLYRSLGTQWGEIHCIQRLGDVHLSLAEYGEARGRFEEARLLYRSLGDGLGEAHCVKSLGDLHFRMAEYSRARERYENALLLYRSLGARLGETECLASLNRLLVAEITQPLKVHSPFVVRLVSAMEVFDEAQPTTESLERLREVLVEGFAEEETAEITASLLTGEFVWRLQKECCDDLLSWLERIDGWLPPERQGLFRSIEVAARHLRGADEDRRLLDQQPPEVRAIVEEIIREAGK
jgi:tetratricopeptide (TPR) repeat protein